MPLLGPIELGSIISAIAHQGKLLSLQDMIVLASLDKEKIWSTSSQIYITMLRKEGGRMQKTLQDAG